MITSVHESGSSAIVCPTARRKSTNIAPAFVARLVVLATDREQNSLQSRIAKIALVIMAVLLTFFTLGIGWIYVSKVYRSFEEKRTRAMNARSTPPLEKISPGNSAFIKRGGSLTPSITYKQPSVNLTLPSQFTL